MALSKKIICLFDVDGTLTAPRKMITPEMRRFIIEEIQPRCAVGLVGGSDEAKISEQMGGLEVIDKFDYVFSENGLVAKRKGMEIERTSILSYMGEEKLQTFINFALKCLSEIRLPAKRGTFIEFRTGLINVCPVGRSCNQQERDEFGEYDKVHKIRESLVQKFKNQFPDFGLNYVIGGQISIDVFPQGWDKTYCLKFVNGFDEIHFFGDKTQPGGNDYELFIDSSTKGYTVLGPDDTKKQLEKLFGL
uniref:Phosphomannomutase n=1 Tax=Cuerna arida TaxID=1464854 RepID=A0A1B6G4M1_9HEMI